jgi:cardiolipin synthase
MRWHELFAFAAQALRIFFLVVALALVPLVLVRRKDPSSTIAWILTLVFMPALGSFLFLLFGRDRVRLPAKRKRDLDALVRAQVAASRRERSDAERVSNLPAPSPLERARFRIGERLTSLRATSGNKVDVLADGQETYDAIDSARHHVHAQYSLIRNDATGAWFRDRLVAAAKRGVHVRLLMDGCFALGSSWRRPLSQAGGQAALFFPVQSALFQPVNLRNHRKIVVVDGETAFTGGFNIGDEYKGNMPGVGAWQDLHLRIEGPAAAELQRVFFQDWAVATNQPIDPRGYFPTEPPIRGEATIVPSGPDTRTEAIHRLFFGAIVGAVSEVVVTTPYFVPTESLMVAMDLAAMRGVDVKLFAAGALEPPRDVPRGPELLLGSAEGRRRDPRVRARNGAREEPHLGRPDLARREREHGSPQLSPELRGARSRARLDDRRPFARNVRGELRKEPARGARRLDRAAMDAAVEGGRGEAGIAATLSIGQTTRRTRYRGERSWIQRSD